jgi:hypothetical protein
MGETQTQNNNTTQPTATSNGYGTAFTIQNIMDSFAQKYAMWEKSSANKFDGGLGYKSGGSGNLYKGTTSPVLYDADGNFVPTKSDNPKPQAESNLFGNIATGVSAVGQLGQGIAGLLQAMAAQKYQKKMASLYEKQFNQNTARQEAVQANYNKVYGA